MRLKYLNLTFFIAFYSFWCNAAETNPSIDTTSSKYKLWEALKIDTLPYHVSHKNVSKQAESSFLRLIAANGIDSTGIRNLYLRAYYDNLLAKNDQLLDFFEQNLNEFPAYRSELLGHFGLRRILSCYNTPSDSCTSIVKWGIQYLKEAADKSTVMPKGQWQWLYKRFQKDLPYSNFDDQIKIQATPSVFSQKNWEGAIINFHRTPGSKNLLISDGSRFPLQILEWDTLTSTWLDVTSLTGLDSFPGGYRLYAGDINNDQYEDLIILRSASTRMSPAKLFPSILINQKDGTFKDIALETGLNAIIKPQCACVADINQDGLMDIFFGNLRDQSIFLVQNEDGSFTDKRNSFGMDEFRNNIQDCAFFDANGDGYVDVLLSGYNSDNKLYLQSFTQTGRRYFDNKTNEYGLSALTYGGAIIPVPTSDAPTGHLFLSEVSERYDILPNILNQLDSVQKDTSLYLIPKKDQLELQTLPKELSVYKTGVTIQTLDGPVIIYSGGKLTETILPYFSYRVGDSTIKVAYNEGLPIYAHSTTVIESDGQPVIIFRGGGDYPAMQSGTAFVEYRPDSAGRYHKIFDIQQKKIGERVAYTIESPAGEKIERALIVGIRDSRGHYAMQEWIWLPEGYQLLKNDLQEIRKGEGSKKKKSKKNKS